MWRLSRSLVKVPLNVRVDSALLSLNGRARYRDRKPEPLINYQGRVVLGRVHVLDKVTNDDFLRWNSLALTGMKVRMGERRATCRYRRHCCQRFLCTRDRPTAMVASTCRTSYPTQRKRPFR